MLCGAVEKLIKRQRGLKVLVQARNNWNHSGCVNPWTCLYNGEVYKSLIFHVSGLQHSKTVQETRVSVKSGETGMVPGRDAEDQTNRLSPTEFYASEINILLIVQSNS